jgi:hypothetical protein
MDSLWPINTIFNFIKNQLACVRSISTFAARFEKAIPQKECRFGAKVL